MSGPNKPVDFNIPAGSPMGPFMDDVAKTIVQQPDYRGIGGHGPEDHHGGLHSQVNIGIGDNTTVNIRHGR